MVRDLGSTNGIRINGNRVLEGKLKAGDELTVGNFKYQICWDMPGEPAAKPKPVKATSSSQPAPILSKPVDQLLEDADEPIPLDEDVPVSRVLKAKAAPRSSRSNGSVKSDAALREILPEDLSLIPPSGSVQQAG